MVNPGKQWLTVSEVAAIEGVSTETIRRGIKAFKYPASRASDAPRAPWLIDAALYADGRTLDAEHSSARLQLATAANPAIHVALVVDRTLVDDMPAETLQELLGQMAYSKIKKLMGPDEL